MPSPALRLSGRLRRSRRSCVAIPTVNGNRGYDLASTLPATGRPEPPAKSR
jgi:hypothetical protein